MWNQWLEAELVVKAGGKTLPAGELGISIPLGISNKLLNWLPCGWDESYKEGQLLVFVLVGPRQFIPVCLGPPQPHQCHPCRMSSPVESPVLCASFSLPATEESSLSPKWVIRINYVILNVLLSTGRTKPDNWIICNYANTIWTFLGLSLLPVIFQSCLKTEDEKWCAHFGMVSCQ